MDSASQLETLGVSLSFHAQNKRKDVATVHLRAWEGEARAAEVQPRGRVDGAGGRGGAVEESGGFPGAGCAAFGANARCPLGGGCGGPGTAGGTSCRAWGACVTARR